MMRTLGLAIISCLLILLGTARLAFADKSAVSISAPAAAAKGEEVIVKITVTHSANSSLHYTQWLKVWANGKELASFIYSGSQLPEGATFAKELKTRITEDTEIKAEASCNIHGSKGPQTVKIIAR